MPYLCSGRWQTVICDRQTANCHSMANSSHYSGWLGGYAKSVAGTVSAFTQDILEETRADTQGWSGVLFISFCYLI